MKYRHYAPKAPVTVVTGDPEQSAAYIAAHAGPGDGVICFDEFLPLYGGETRPVMDLGPAGDKEEQARQMFDALRAFDHTAVSRHLGPVPHQEDVARALFCPRQTISKWETDKAEPGMDNLKVLADFTGCFGPADQPSSDGTDPKESHEQTPSDQYRTMALRSAWQFGWRWQRQASCMEASPSRSLPLGDAGPAAVFLSLWVRHLCVGRHSCAGRA